MPPDLSVCEECRKELFNTGNRRYLYPFINCTNCGPRFTIIHELPYDREKTSMSKFKLCSECQKEYIDPADRRFDAQPNACLKCGPKVKLINEDGEKISDNPIEEAVRLIKKGAIIAVKGLGGYHLCCEASNNKAVSLLRERKNRPAKSLSVMFISRPIVVLSVHDRHNLSSLISPDTNDIGAFLPYTPLHYLLLSEVSPLIMTSGNLSEEPIAKDEKELNFILKKIADYALIHNRDIIRRCDDSVIKVVKNRTLFFRRSRGFVPEPINISFEGPPILACGAELKNTFCLTRGNKVFMSQHIGDLSDYPSYDFFCEAINDLKHLLKIEPEIIACDMHPDYLSTRYALNPALPKSKDAGRKGGVKKKIPVQHHHAHIASCMAEHQISEPVIGVALDGTGFGPDGTIWGGEFLIADLKQYRRAGYFKKYPMPGGDKAILNPIRMALSYLFTEMGDDHKKTCKSLLTGLSDNEYSVLTRMIKKGINSPMTSSAGRLFDAVAALLGISKTISYEGQAAIRLQTLARPGINSCYKFDIIEKRDMFTLSFGPMICEIISDINSGVDKEDISAMFHNTVSQAIVKMCSLIKSKENIKKVVLSGGVFQNDLLVSLVTDALNNNGFEVYNHNIVPPNDGGIALGQAVVAMAKQIGNRVQGSGDRGFV
jgi:hydrogenase maturation protein HypF